MIEALKSLKFQVDFALAPIKAIQHRYEGNEMEQAFGNNFHCLDENFKSNARIPQKFINIIKRFIPNQFCFLKDLILLDGFITSEIIQKYKELLVKVEPDVVIFEYALMTLLAEHTPRKVIKILDTHDKFTDRNKRIRDEGGDGLWWTLLEKQERVAINRVDRVIGIQKHETAWFKNLTSDNTTRVFTLDILSPALRKCGIETIPNSIGFVGSSNSHNEKGLKNFLDEHWNKILENNNSVQLYVAGAKYESITKENYPNIKFLGRVNDLGKFYDKICIAINPCLTGSGLKIKSVEALSYGKPLISTPEGATGIEDAVDDGLIIEDLYSEEYSKNIIELINNPEKRKNQGERAIRYINEKYDKNINALKIECNG